MAKDNYDRGKSQSANCYQRNLDKVAQMYQTIGEIAPKLYQRLNEFEIGQGQAMDVFFNLYNFTLHSCCFSSEIPLEISCRIFEWVLFA